VKKALAILISIVLIMSLSGCWDYVEYENLAMVHGMGIDYNSDTNEITVIIQNEETKKPEGGGMGAGSVKSKEQPSKGVVVSATAITITDALDKIQQGIQKEMFYGYLSVLIVGDNAARYITKDILEFYNRSSKLRTTAYIVIAKGEASDVLNTYNPNVSTIVSDYISGVIKNFKNTGSAYAVTIADFIEKLAVGGDEPVAPIISVIVMSKKPQQDTNESKEELSHIMPMESKEGQVYISNMAVFKGSKLVGWLNEEESRGLVWVKNKNENTYINITQNSEKSSVRTMSFRVTNSKSSIKPSRENGEITFNILVKIEAELRKHSSNNGTSEFTPEVISDMEKKISEYVRGEVESVIVKAQKEYKSDIFGFGNIYYKRFPGMWREKYEKKWNDLFPQVPVNINVVAKVVNTGINIIPLEEK
jgi:spore germination protein KC